MRISVLESFQFWENLLSCFNAAVHFLAVLLSAGQTIHCIFSVVGKGQGLHFLPLFVSSLHCSVLATCRSPRKVGVASQIQPSLLSLPALTEKAGSLAWPDINSVFLISPFHLPFPSFLPSVPSSLSLSKSQSLTNTFPLAEAPAPRGSLSQDEVRAESIRSLRQSFASLFSD